MAKIYFDNRAVKKGELKNLLKEDERQLREIRRIEQQSGTTTSKENEIYFRKKGGF